MDLNEISVNDAEGPGVQNDYSIINEKSDVEVCFKNIEEFIISKIEKHSYIVGCMAWLTNENILKALSKKSSVSIIVQEEDFLRPDSSFDGHKLKWKNKIRSLYDNLPKGSIYLMELSGQMINCAGDQGEIIGGIRRLGKLNTEKSPAFPRMHNKFIVCYEGGGLAGGRFCAEVLTGSFNFSENSNNSLENVVCLKDSDIVNAFIKQYTEICLMSVELDWNGDWEPQPDNGLRYGT